MYESGSALDESFGGSPRDDGSSDSQSYSRALKLIARLAFGSLMSAQQHGGKYKNHSQALRLIARLGQPFGALLLVQQRGGEYKRIASDNNIIAQVRDMAAVRDMMDIRMLEIL
ncbi:hypothetical protein DFH29DRAFT_970689 [Suillus ampliporus]|nr:hypothetical protein DFH29DRAFT_970689 [Suillus ampliporus]